MSDLLPVLFHEFQRHKSLADDAIVPLSDEQFFAQPAAASNSIALVVKHVAGNLRSRWTDLLTSDGEKPDRDRDAEFILTASDTRSRLLSAWDVGWDAVFVKLDELEPADVDRTITIRGEPHTVLQALVRGLTHAAYHVGQILYIARLLAPGTPWLTIPPGQSRDWPARYLKS
jgi:uncharacterized damage-inducible protein DinB